MKNFSKEFYKKNYKNNFTNEFEKVLEIFTKNSDHTIYCIGKIKLAKISENFR